ncbi:MAG: holo-ACP synthase [Schwartzia sp.]|nr:holo-ACP synthase [Schwartzia sp. (in: firmicutes)]
MHIRTGIDLVEVKRVEKAIQKQHFIDTVYTKKEQEYCDARGRGRSASYAARWAAKEAVVKALGTGFSGGALTDIEIINDDAGCPQVTLHGGFERHAETVGVREISISMTHVKEYAAASCCIEEEKSQ